MTSSLHTEEARAMVENNEPVAMRTRSHAKTRKMVFTELVTKKRTRRSIIRRKPDFYIRAQFSVPISPVTIRLETYDNFIVAYQVCASILQISMSQFELRFDGIRIHEGTTPEELGLEKGDLIDFHAIKA